MAESKLTLVLDRDWIRLNVFRMALEVIVAEHAKNPWDFSGEEAAAVARTALEYYGPSEDPDA